jgi:hypothetical protein
MEDILISLLPIIIVVGVWIFIMLRMKKNSKNNVYVSNQIEMIDLLKEIRDELKELKKNNSIK